LRPNAKIIQEIHKLSCVRVAHIAKYIMYRQHESLKFGKQTTTLVKFCQQWEGFEAKTFQIRAWSGPPNKMAYYSMPLSSLVVDWYFKALDRKNQHSIRKLEDMLLSEADR